jgi:hypothetical protein
MHLSLLVLLLAAAPSLSVDAWWTDLPGLVSPPSAPSTTQMNWVQILQRSGVSSRSAQELKAHFAARFAKAGLYLAPEQEKWQPQVGAQVTGLDTDQLISYSALLQPSGKVTTVVLTASAVGVRKTTPAKELIGPVYPGSSEATSFEVETMKAISYSTGATPAELKAFYRDTLTKAGYREQEDQLAERDVMVQRLTLEPGAVPQKR